MSCLAGDDDDEGDTTRPTFPAAPMQEFPRYSSLHRHRASNTSIRQSRRARIRTNPIAQFTKKNPFCLTTSQADSGHSCPFCSMHTYVLITGPTLCTSHASIGSRRIELFAKNEIFSPNEMTTSKCISWRTSNLTRLLETLLIVCVRMAQSHTITKPS